MPAPSANYILALLGGHQQFKPDSSGAIALAGLGEQRQGRKENARQFDIESARKDEYLGMQQHQMEMNQVNRNQDKLMEAFREFNEAVVDGDEERAAAAARNIRALGGEVEEYSGESAPAGGAQPPTGATPTATPPPATGPGGAARAAAAAQPPSAMNIGAAESPTAKVAKAKPNVPKAPKAPSPTPPSPPASPPNAEVPAWLQRDAEKGGYAPPTGLDTGPFNGLPPATLGRPGPAGSGVVQPPPPESTDPTALLQNLTPEQRQALLGLLQRGMG